MPSKKCSKVNILLNVMNASGGWLDNNLKRTIIGTSEFPNAKSLSNALYQAHVRGLVERGSVDKCLWYISSDGYDYLDAISQKIEAEASNDASCADDEVILLRNKLVKTIDDRNRFYNKCCEMSKQIEALTKKCSELIYENESLKTSLEHQKSMTNDAIKTYNSLNEKYIALCNRPSMSTSLADVIELSRKTIDIVSHMI